MRIVILCGGLAAGRFCADLAVQLMNWPDRQLGADGVEVTIVVNVADDVSVHGLRVCPDLDAVMYAMAAATSHRLQPNTSVVADELAKYGTEPPLLSISDAEMATHVLRTHLLDVGFRLTVVTATLCGRWDLAARIVPIAEERVETHVVVNDGTPGGSALHIQRWRQISVGRPAPVAFLPLGVQSAQATAEVLDALDLADLVLLAPACPVTGLGPMLTVAGLRAAVRAAPCPVLGISPAIGGRLTVDVDPMALATVGIRGTSAAIARHYGARSDHDNPAGLLDGWLVDSVDAELRLDWIDVRPVPLGGVDDHGIARLRPSPALVRAAVGLAAGVDW